MKAAQVLQNTAAALCLLLYCTLVKSHTKSLSLTRFLTINGNVPQDAVSHHPAPHRPQPRSMIQDIKDHNDDLTISSRQIAVLKEHFPACFSADGSFDITRFQEEIKDHADIVHEGYELKFLGKSYAKLLASTDTTTVIVPDEAHNSLPENAQSENIYISGDNLDGLKHLLKSYSESIKCIYIDPPYNTGSDGFVYRDNFGYTAETLQEKLNVSEDEAHRILELTRRGSASHSAWLMFMYCRLLLARDVLAKDGVIFISIDDNEQANLKLLCDDVFGEENFVANVIWEKKYSPQNDAKWFSATHDYITIYSKDKEIWRPRQSERTKEANARYKNPDNDPRGPWKMSDLSVKTYSPDYDYPIVTPSGKSIELPKGRCWMTSKSNMQKLIDDNRIWFGKDGNNVPALKRFLSEVKDGITPMTMWFRKDVGDNQEGKQELLNLIPENIFQTPKVVRLLKKIIYHSNAFENDIILDFFSGSATTAHAVMKLNAEDGGNRKFIAVQLPEVLSKEDASQKAAYEFLEENQLPTTLDYIGIERIKRAAAKIRAEQEEKAKAKEGDLFGDGAVQTLDLGFRHYTLAEPNQNTLDKLESFDRANFIVDTTVLEDFGRPTVLATWLNADGYGLTATPESIDLAGYTAYYYGKHVYLIDEGFTLDSMKALLAKYDADGSFNPENIVLFGYSFPEWSITEMIEKNLRILNDGEKNLKINYAVRY